MKVITKDFQILKDTIEWDFPVGITIIQGESGNGKSTLIYAIQDCLCNPAGVDDVINWDAKQAEVTIENNGQKVKWVKTKSSSTYYNELTGEEYIKASKLDSRDIGNLGFYFDPKDNVINIHDEWCKLFPFGATDTEMFKLFEDIFNISSSFRIIEEIKEDEKDIKNQITEINKEVNKLKQQKLEIENIFKSVDIISVDTQINDLISGENNYKDICQDYADYKNQIVYTQIQLPEDFNTSSLYNANIHYNQLNDDYSVYIANNKLTNVILPENKIFDFSAPEILQDELEYNILKQQISDYNMQVNQLDLVLTNLQEKLSQIKICPTCGRPLE